MSKYSNRHVWLSKRGDPRKQAGLSLVELMIAVTISLLITVALISLLININRSNTEMAKVNAQIENGRFAIQLLQQDLVHAGYWGGYIPQFDDLSVTTAPADVPSAIPDPCRAYDDPATPWNADYKNGLLGIPVQSYDAVPSGCSGIITNKKAGTDVLVVRHAETCLPGTPNCAANVTGRLYFQASNCENEIKNGVRYVLDTAGFDLKNRGCTGTPPAATTGVAAATRRFVSHIYYIRDYAITEGDGIPTLMRAEFDLVDGTPQHKDAEALIENIEGFRVELGIDNKSRNGNSVDAASYSAAVTWADPATKKSPTNRGDGVPDTYVRCTTASACTLDSLLNVTAVKIYILARNREVSPGYVDNKKYQLAGETLPAFNDGFKRHVFSTTVRLINISGRRETPP